MAVRFGEELERLGVQYALTGSVAASLFGEPRSTVDIDFTVMTQFESLAGLSDLDDEFYV